jgi:hypothetical protein
MKKPQSYKYQRLDKEYPDKGWQDIDISTLHHKISLCYSNHIDVIAAAIVDPGMVVKTPFALYRVVKLGV